MLDLDSLVLNDLLGSAQYSREGLFGGDLRAILSEGVQEIGEVDQRFLGPAFFA